MASVYYLFDDAKDITENITWRSEANYELDRRRYFAAVLIQRAFRSFIAWRNYKKMEKAVITIQKHVRGFLLKTNLVEVADTAYKDKSMSLFNKSSTKIQSNWRGYWTRKTVDLQSILEEKREAEATQEAMRDFFKNIFKQNDDDDFDDILPPISNITKEEHKRIVMAKRSNDILQLIFDKHHLLRTHQIEGVLSEHGSKKLSLLERILKTLDCKEYMDMVRGLYKEDHKPKLEYMFSDRRARRIEDLLREKECREGVERFEGITKKMTDKDDQKPFVLSRKRDDGRYERNMLSGEVYTGCPKVVLRGEDGESDPRFVLDTKHITRGGKNEQPYFIDHWKKMCCHHNFTYNCDDDRKS